MEAPHFGMCAEKDMEPPLHKVYLPVSEMPENADKNEG